MLRRCPFCESWDIVFQARKTKKGKVYRCKCRDCDIAIRYWHDTKEEAAEFWNKSCLEMKGERI